MLKKLLSLFLIAVLVVSSPAVVFAAGSGAFRVELPDAGAFGMGSAFIGEADTPGALYYNPAGISQMEGNHIAVGMAVVQPRITHDNAGIETKMRINTSWIPHTYFVTDLGLDKWTFGVGSGTNWGTKTDWGPDSFARYISTTTELISIDSNVVAAYELTEDISVAAGLRISHQDASLERNLRQDSGAFPDATSQLKGDDTAFGYTLSVHYKLNEQHNFGLQYRSAIEQRLKGYANLHGLQGTFAAVFGGTSFRTAAEVDLEMPQVISAGYSFKPDDKWTFNFDVEMTDWSGSEQFKVNYTDPTLTSNQSLVLNTDNPASRDWEWAFSTAFGTEYAYSDNLRLRAGYYFHETPIPAANLDTTIPDSDSHGLAVGFGYDVKENVTLDFGYSLLLFEDRKINNNVGSNLGGSVDGEYEEYVNMATATITYTF